MLDEKKVRLMARTALYEQSFGNGTIKLNKQFAKGAYRKAFFQHLPAGIVTFLLAAFLACAFGQSWIREIYYRLGEGLSLLFLAVIFVIFVILYAFYARNMTKKKYEKEKGVFWKYRFTKDKLKGMTAGQRSEKENGGAGA